MTTFRIKRSGVEAGCLAVLFVALPVVVLPDGLDPFTLPKQALLMLAGVAIVATWLALGGPRLRRREVLGLSLFGLSAAVSTVVSVDPLGSIFGFYGNRHGLVTILAVLVVSLAMADLAPSGRALRCVALAGAAGATVVGAEAVLEAWGLVPAVHPGSGRLAGLVGNRNELAGFTVVSVGWAGLAFRGSSRLALVARLALVSFAATVVVMTESRAGVAGLATAALVLVATTIRRRGWRDSRRPIGLGAAASLVVAVSFLPNGVLMDNAARWSHTLRHSSEHEDSYQGRVDIWRGAWSVFAAHPLLGAGPDALAVEFQRHRPPALGPPFNASTAVRADPLVASPHNLVLELLVSVGVVGTGLVIVAAGIVFSGSTGCSRLLDTEGSDFVLAALFGFGCFALADPFSLASLATFAGLGGVLIGRRRPFARPEPRKAEHFLLGVAFGTCAVAAALAILVALSRADHHALLSVEATNAGDYQTAVKHAQRATDAVPFEQAYRRQLVRAEAALGVWNGDLNLLNQALTDQESLLQDFLGLPVDYLSLAYLRLAAGRSGVGEALAQARAASPFGVDTGRQAAEIERAALARGIP
jgi:O-antigen ligase